MPLTAQQNQLSHHLRNVLPLSSDYQRSVLHSLETHTQFWESLLSEENYPKSTCISEFPWKNEQDPSTQLDDLVMLKFIDPSSLSRTLCEEVGTHLEKAEVPSLQELLGGETGGSSGGCSPILLVFDPSSVISQVNLYHLEPELKKHAQVSTLINFMCSSIPPL